MTWLSRIAILVVAGIHLWFLVLEMFLWTTPIGRRVFGLSREAADTTKSLAANQGLYNGFLVAGLVWAAVTDQRDVATFFLVCVIVAGIYGASTVNKRILVVQALPAAIALALMWIR